MYLVLIKIRVCGDKNGENQSIFANTCVTDCRIIGALVCSYGHPNQRLKAYVWLNRRDPNFEKQ
jgi:hypothetical protein